MAKDNFIVPSERIISRIFVIRGKKVMLDKDLAELYKVENKNLKRTVRRNIEIFPEDFMFELSDEELEALRCQFGTSKKGGIRYEPFAFTKQGVAMLSTVQKSKRAIMINIEIIRTFSKMLASNRDLRLKIEDMERRYDKNFQNIFDTFRKMIQEEQKPKKVMGFCYRK